MDMDLYTARFFKTGNVFILGAIKVTLQDPEYVHAESDYVYDVMFLWTWFQLTSPIIENMRTTVIFIHAHKGEVRTWTLFYFYF